MTFMNDNDPTERFKISNFYPHFEKFTSHEELSTLMSKEDSASVSSREEQFLTKLRTEFFENINKKLSSLLVSN